MADGRFDSASHAPDLRSRCHVCDCATPTLVMPDRSVGEWRFYSLCTLCIDEFLGVYSGVFFALRRRELSGRLV